MNTIVRKHLSISPYAGQGRLEPSADTQQLLLLGRNRNWGFQVLGRAPMPETAFRVGDWLLAPAQSDSTAIPVRSLARVQAILRAGIRLQGFVLVHEAPKLLNAPAGSSRPSAALSQSPQQSLVKWLGAAGGVLAVAAAAAAGLVIVAVVVMALASILIVPALLLVAAAGVDPILVAVTDDSHWIEIDRWNTE